MRIKPRFKKRRTNRTNGICNFFAFFHSPTRIRASRCILPSLLRRVFPGRGALAPAAPDGEEPSNTPGICQSYDSDIFPLAVSAPVAWGRGAEKSGPLGRSRPQPAQAANRPRDEGGQDAGGAVLGGPTEASAQKGREGARCGAEGGPWDHPEQPEGDRRTECRSRPSRPKGVARRSVASGPPPWGPGAEGGSRCAGGRRARTFL